MTNSTPIVTKASVAECIEILTEPQIFPSIPVSHESQVKNFVRYNEHRFHKIQVASYSLIFVYYPIGDIERGIYEFHIACPKKNIRACRILGFSLLIWLAENVQGIKALTTNCPEGKIANMCRKMGGLEIIKDTTCDLIHFMLSIKQLFKLRGDKL